MKGTPTVKAGCMKAILVLVLPLTISAPLWADDGLGRLFFSPQERALLNTQRSKNAGLIGDSSETLTVNGLVTRSSGRSTVWLNGTPRHEDPSPAGGSATPHQGAGGKVRLQLPSDGRAVDLQVGQTLDTASGRVRDVHERAPATE